jgi:predicted dehydrogenase
MLAPNHETSYRPAMTHFVDSVRRGRAASPDLADGYRSLQVVLAAEQSARAGKPVTLA